MNIFVLDLNPKKAAIYHSDKHCVKMILESAQLLSTAHHVLDSEKVIKGIYRKSFVNHPVAIWVRKCSANYMWTYLLLKELLQEYTFRYHKIHATARLLPLLKHLPKKIVMNKKITPFTQAMPDNLKDKNAVEAYRNYYIKTKSKINVWKHRPAPAWYLKSINNEQTPQS